MAVTAIKDSVKLFIGTGETLTLADAIGKKTSIGDIGGEGAEEIDVTTMESAAKETEKGLEDYGSFDVTQILTGDEYAKMVALKKADTKIKWAISIVNKAGEQIVGVQGVGDITNVKLTNLSTNSVVNVVTTIRVSDEPTQEFELPTA